MQNTRLTVLFDVLLRQFAQWIRNPWRRIAMLIVGVLFGNFAATVISTITGQTAEWDVLVSLLLLLACELVSWLVYRRRASDSIASDSSSPIQLSPVSSPPAPAPAGPIVLQIANAVKLGMIYGLFVEAFKLGS
ncbi:MAG: DUF565 domain-containing protein [Cyanothece sp. SIO2G6]|nr:DUF565 domain-containing protein [Cyanothece sp. SIO2G6]